MAIAAATTGAKRPATKPRPATKAAQREASTEALLAAALALFVSRGYQHTSVEQIAARAGLTKGSVYFYFRSKSALLMALLDRVEDVVADAMQTRVSGAGAASATGAAGGGGADARGKLVAFLHGQAMLGVEKWEHVLLLILMSLEYHGRGDEIEARLKAIYTRLYDTVEGIIGLGKSNGEFRADVATREQAAIVIAAHDGTFLEWYRRRAELDGTELVRALRVAMIGALTRIDAGPHDPTPKRPTPSNGGEA